MKTLFRYQYARTLAGISAVLTLASLAGCAAVGPDYTPPGLVVPPSWQAVLPHEGSTGTLLNWWTTFNDPVLDTLLRTAETDNPTIDRAAAAIAAARASSERAGAERLPTIDAAAGVSRAGAFQSPSAVPAATTSSGALDASWEIDLFGSVRRNNEAATARLQARSAEWHDARISLAAEVASDYVTYRACHMLVQSQQANLASLRKTASSTQVLIDNELSAPAESTLAGAGVANAAASLRAQQAECDLGLKALVTLTGIAEPELRAKLDAARPRIPEPGGFDVKTVPVQLLSQRPDLVAAERSLAAASADIGVAEANRYPRISLLGSISAARTVAVGTGVSTSPWSFGPSLSLPLFDGGRLRAQVASATAAYQSALATYKGAVRSAVQEAEQALVRLDAATQRRQDVAKAANGYRSYFDSAEANWKAGGISLLTLEEARRNALQAEQNDISTRRDRVLYGIALYKALGGGWLNDNKTAAGVSP